MDNDLNTAEALAAVFEYVRSMNTALDEGRYFEENRWESARVLKVFDDIFAVLRPLEAPPREGMSEANIEALIEERNQAKRNRAFARADEIRATLLEAGVVLEDTKDGTRWKRK
jgi:cysteinyl-tRNA synthetase